MKFPNSYWDHVYTSLNYNSTIIAESSGSSGVRINNSRSFEYERRTQAYLKLKLPEYRRFGR
jgi:hypothetical protein